ncbi:MAG: C1 family peptidase [Alistipes sp.]|nr:C1 family peptidase [Candidatus Alistipes equi]
MKKALLLATCLMFIVTQVTAQDITKEMIAEFHQNAIQSEDTAIRNALVSNAINDLASNASLRAMCDTHFTYTVKTSGITNQRSSGRCWLFSGLNVLRAQIIDKYNLSNFEFSEVYLSFHDLLEKGNLFLQSIIDTRSLPLTDRKVDWLLRHPIGDGGQFTGVANLIKKYGAVPKEVMAETYHSENTRQMLSILTLKLRGYAMELRKIKNEKEALTLKKERLKEFYRILTLCLGVPPTEFSWAMYNKKGEKLSEETYTPQSFYEKYFGADLMQDIVLIMNDPSREFNRLYEVDQSRHIYEGNNWKYLNLDIDTIRKIAVESIKDNTPLYFSCDVGKFLNRKQGTLNLKNFDYASLFKTEFPMEKAERIQSYASGSSHAMMLMGVDVSPEGKVKKWKIENSWGKTAGYQGYLIMTDDWFNEYMFRLVARTKYVPEDVLKLLKQKPIKLPAWDPLYSYDF